LSLATHSTCSVEISLGLATIPNNSTVTLYRQLTMSHTQQQEKNRIEKRECQIFVKILAISPSLLVFHPINPFQSIHSTQSIPINPFQSIHSNQPIPINPFQSIHSIKSTLLNPLHPFHPLPSIQSTPSTPLHRQRHE
jgi:hypothetical protein